MDEITLQPILYGTPPEEGRLTTLQRAEAIRNVEMFSRARVEELLRLATIAHEITFPARHVIYREDEPGDVLYLIVKGKVELACGDTRETAEPYQTFGTYAILTGGPRRVTAIAVEDTCVLTISREDFLDLLSRNTDILESVFRMLVEKIGFNGRC